MVRSSFLQLLLISVVILIMAGLGYAGWKFKGKKEMESEPILITSPTLEETDKPEEEKLEISEIDTNDWKTYRNEEYGFEIKYPSSWIREDRALNTTFFPAGSQGIEQHPFIGIKIKPNQEDKNIRDFYNGVKERDLFSQSNNQYEYFELKGFPCFKFVPYITFVPEIIWVIQLDNAFVELVDFGATNQQSGIFDTAFSTFDIL